MMAAGTKRPGRGGRKAPDWVTVCAMDECERVSVNLPAEYAEQIRQIVSAGNADSIASYVLEAVQARLHRDQSLSELKDLFDRKGQGPSAQHLAWARDVLGVRDTHGGGAAS